MNLEQYKSNGRNSYADLARTVSSILQFAIDAEKGYMLQQVASRAKNIESLRNKLEKREIQSNETIEQEIKDLAGCRIIFYTNGDVTRFLNSGIIHENFEILERKIHYPGLNQNETQQLYRADHFVVGLRPERLALPEYSRFIGMRCEIQIQTILNHAWAEMEHDIVYKAPELNEFGKRAFDGIKNRLAKISKRYLVPAGYEFQKVAIDFKRLIEGKQLLDGKPLETIVEAPDNNIRLEALQTFSESILPYYDREELQAMYPEVVEHLLNAVEQARTAAVTDIETPFGNIPGKTFDDVFEAVLEVFRLFRYVEVTSTFNGLCELFLVAESEEEKKKTISVAEDLAKNEIKIWRSHGPIVQSMLVERIEGIPVSERQKLTPLLTAMLSEVLDSEVSGTTSDSTSVTLQNAPINPSEMLKDLRRKAIELLKTQFDITINDGERRQVLHALRNATRSPYRGFYSNALALQIMKDTLAVTQFETEIIEKLSLPLLQSVEISVHHSYEVSSNLPPDMKEDAELAAAAAQVKAAALAFREVANADDDFVKYKILVGFDSIFPPAWERDKFDHEDEKLYRHEKVEELLSSVNETNANSWFDRLDRYAKTESNDLATFAVLGDFLSRLAKRQPTVVLGYINKLVPPIEGFLPGLLDGLTQSAAKEDAFEIMSGWIKNGERLKYIARYLEFTAQFDEQLLRRTLDSAICNEDVWAVNTVVQAAERQFRRNPGTIVDEVFVPALRYLAEKNNLAWVTGSFWYHSPIMEALTDVQAHLVLEAMIPFPHMERQVDYIAAGIAKTWPSLVLEFLGKRQVFAKAEAAPKGYDAIPFEVHELKEPLSLVPELMIGVARDWHSNDPETFRFDGAKLLASVFPGLSAGLNASLETLVDSRDREQIRFVLAILSAFEGADAIYPLAKKIVSLLQSNDELIDDVHSVLRESGVVTGMYGFAELHASRRALLQAWLDDPNPTVQEFAKEHIESLEGQIAAETRAAEDSRAARKLEHDEDLDDEDDEEGDDDKPQ